MSEVHSTEILLFVKQITKYNHMLVLILETALQGDSVIP